MSVFEIFALCALPMLAILLFLNSRALERERRRSYLLYMVSEKLKDNCITIWHDTYRDSTNLPAEKLQAAVYSSYMDARKIIDSKNLK